VTRPTNATDPSSPDGKEVVRTLHDRLWGGGDLTAIDDAFDPAAVTHWAGFSSNTVDAVRADATRYFGAFADVSTSIAELLADGDKVVLRWKTTGKHVGPYGDVAATGRVITMEGIDIHRIAGGRIVESWSLWDGVEVYRQLGVLPDGL
jgi:predicted ester cyclase